MEYEGSQGEIGRVYKLASKEGKMDVAFDAAVALQDFESIAQLNLQVISAGRNHLVALRRDGTVVSAGNNDEGQCDVQSWADIISVAAGYNYTVGLRADGTVVATGFNNKRQCNVQDWTDIVAIYAGNTATDTVGVKADGIIVLTGSLAVSYTHLDVYKRQVRCAIPGPSCHDAPSKRNGAIIPLSDSPGQRRGTDSVGGSRR